MKARTKYLAVFLLGLIVGMALQYAYLTYIWPNRHRSYTWIYGWRDHKDLGEPGEADLVLDRTGYSLGYSFERKTPLWVSYVVTDDSVGVDVGRHGSFYMDQDIPEEYRTRPENYANTGYDKGHLAPSATIDFSEPANRETFALSNITFQDPELNRKAWGKLEDIVRSWTASKGKLYVITGPIYTARPKMVNGIPVPAKFYKIIYAYDAEKAIAFIMPNKAVEEKNLWRYVKTVQEVEEQTGLTFFSELSETDQRALKGDVDRDWWKAGL